MKALLLGLILAVVCLAQASAFGTIACQSQGASIIACTHSQDEKTESDSVTAALNMCNRLKSPDQNCITVGTVHDTCVSVYHTPNNAAYLSIKQDANFPTANFLAQAECTRTSFVGCVLLLTFCDRTAPSALSAPAPSTASKSAIPTQSSNPGFAAPWQMIANFEPSDFVDVYAVRTGISFGIGIIIALLIFARRTSIANVLIHGNLPQKLPVYGEDIQVLFKRTQRVNWYGRVVFGIVANLAMTHQQLIDVRKYWLGRVIAFDSLRRQRQNELARMHLQLATSVKSDPKDKKPLSQLLAGLKFIFFVAFYLIRALFSFLFGFLFIRVTIAKLVRGTIVESKDLVLILQAKEAIEQSASYLKEYLSAANSFDGHDEVYDAE